MRFTVSNQILEDAGVACATPPVTQVCRQVLSKSICDPVLLESAFSFAHGAHVRII